MYDIHEGDRVKRRNDGQLGTVLVDYLDGTLLVRYDELPQRPFRHLQSSFIKWED